MSLPKLLSIAMCFTLLVACSDNNNNSPEPTVPAEPEFLPIAVPTVSNPPDAGEPFLQANAFDLADVGYEQQEYFLDGTATAFANTNEFLNDGLWQAEPGEQAEYKTRILVHRPVDPVAFNGSVLVEWLNVTAGFETPPSWGTGHVEMYRQGHIWIGVSVQLVGIEGRPGSLAPLHLKNVNPDRYGSLVHPGDSFSYDMFSQVSAVLREPAPIDVLNGMVADRVVAYGESQSASRLVTYINAVQLLYNAYDGFMVHSRGAGSAPLAQEPQVEIPTPDAPRIRTDINVPVMTFETETDVTLLGYVAARQEDTDSFRLWEVAGTSHADRYTIVAGRLDAVGEPQYAAVVEEDTVFGFLKCDNPFNSGPMHYVFNTAIRQLDQWVLNGTLPTEAPRLELNDDQSDYLKDINGNAIGGIRTPYVDAPVAILAGDGQSGESFCFLFGTTFLFTPEQMASLYVDEAGYVAAVATAAVNAVAEGFLLQVDADAINAWAPEQWRFQSEL